MRVVSLQPTLSSRGDNFARIVRVLDDWRAQHPPLGEDDLLLLPEHWSAEEDPGVYLDQVRALAQRAGCHVVGGSHYALDESGRVHRGVAVDAAGNLWGEYEKLRPYARERGLVRAGSRHGSLVLGGHRVLVLLCADFWFFDLIQRARAAPELICVPALSVSRKPNPDYSRALWRHMAISRAYEVGCYVAISDWAHESELPELRSSGVAGLVDPTTTEPERFFSATTGGITAFELSFERLAAFRQDRAARGFLFGVNDADAGPSNETGG